MKDTPLRSDKRPSMSQSSETLPLRFTERLLPLQNQLLPYKCLFTNQFSSPAWRVMSHLRLPPKFKRSLDSLKENALMKDTPLRSDKRPLMSQSSETLPLRFTERLLPLQNQLLPYKCLFTNQFSSLAWRVMSHLRLPPKFKRLLDLLKENALMKDTPLRSDKRPSMSQSSETLPLKSIERLLRPQNQ